MPNTTQSSVQPSDRRRIVVFGGGTVMYVRNHMALCAPAYGGTAKKLATMFQDDGRFDVALRLTKMADASSKLETNDDVERELLHVLTDPSVAGIVFNVALCDFEGQIGSIPSGKYAARLQTREVTEAGLPLILRPTKKLLALVHKLRPDVVSVGFKTTADEAVQIQVDKSNRMAREAGISWMLANDTVTRNNVVLRGIDRVQNGPTTRTVSDALYNGTDRENALAALARGFLDDIAV